MSSTIYGSIKSNNSFGKIHTVLKNSNIKDYIQISSSEDILKQKVLDVSDSIKTKEEFYELLTYLFQSLTNIGYTTYEIISFICETINAEGVFSDNEKKDIINFISQSFCFIHTDYSKYPIYKNKNNKNIIDQIVFGHSDSKDNFNIGLLLNKASSKLIASNKSFKRDIKVLSSFTGIDLNKRNVKFDLNRKFLNRSLNLDVKNPKKYDTSVSSILITNPNIRIGTQNSLEVSTFFNSITTLEMNKSYPYFNATFILPSLSRQDLNSVNNTGNIRSFSVNATSSTLNSFLYGNINNKSKNYNEFSGDKISDDVFKTNMSLFTSPQTLVNLNENIGHSQNNLNSNRKTTVNDPTQPLMTLKSFSINANPTKGLMSYKSGRLSLVLHDRTRMNDIAPFIKPDLLGEFGAEILLEYGWSNPDSDNPKNPLGYFIGNSRVAEKYMIVNSSFSIDNTGLVNIDLSIAMKGPHEFKNQQISSRVDNRITQAEFESELSNIENIIKDLRNSEDSKFFEGYNLNTKNLKGIFNESLRLTKKQIGILSTFKKEYEQLLSIINGNLSNVIEISGSETFFRINYKDKLDENNRKVFNNLLFGSKDPDFFHIISNSKKEIISKINNILASIRKIINLIDSISRQDSEEVDNKRKILENIMGSLEFIDFFYPTSDKLYPEKSQIQYVSLGSIINTIVQIYLAKIKGKKSSQFDEIQTIFYTANENAGKMSNESISSFLINKNMLKDFLEDIFNRNIVITPESLITQIIQNFVRSPDNISLGLSSLYESRDTKSKNKSIKSYKNPVRPLEAYSRTSVFEKEKNKILRNIYGLSDDFPANKIKFKIPIIHMNFDCLSSIGLKNGEERTILRISIFDRVDSPFSSSSEVLQELYSGNINNSVGEFILSRKDFKDNKRPEKVSVDRKNLENYFKNQKKELDDLVEKKLLVKENDKYKINYVRFINNKNFIGSVKDIYKEIYPSLSFGSQNSVMMNANVSTLNDNKLSTIFMTRSDRNDQSLINDRISEQLPLIIMPTQASVEIFGCPWINFGQSIFLDFETGTTLDNKYIVTGITHNFSPGKFTTQLTLSYGDNYGQLKNIEDMLNEKTLNDLSKRRDKFKNNKNKKNNKKITIVVGENYKKEPFYDQRLILQNNVKTTQR
jgi:hypothetical protein